MTQSGGGTSDRRKLTAGSVVLYGSFGVRYVLHLFVASHLGLAAYGDFVFLVGLVGILSLLGQAGFSIAIPKYWTEPELRSEGLEFGALVLGALTTLICSSLFGVLLYLGAPLGNDLAPLLVLGAAMLPGNALMLYAQNVGKACGRLIFHFAPNALVLPATAIVLLVFLPEGNDGEWRFLSGYAIATAVLGLAATVMWPLWREVRQARERASRWLAPIRLIRDSMWQIPGMIGYQALQRADVIVLRPMATPEFVGVYGLAARLSQVVFVANWATNALYAPRLGVATGDEHARVIGEARRSATKAGVLAALLVLLGLPIVIMLVGEGSQRILLPTALLVAAYLVFSPSSVEVTNAQIRGRERVVAGAALLALAAQVIGMVMAARAGSLFGVALANGSAFLILGWTLAFARRMGR